MTVGNLPVTRDYFVENSVVVNPDAPLEAHELRVTRQWFREQRVKCSGKGGRCRFKGWLVPYPIRNPAEPKVWRPVTASCPDCGAPGEDA